MCGSPFHIKTSHKDCTWPNLYNQSASLIQSANTSFNIPSPISFNQSPLTPYPDNSPKTITQATKKPCKCGSRLHSRITTASCSLNPSKIKRVITLIPVINSASNSLLNTVTFYSPITKLI